MGRPRVVKQMAQNFDLAQGKLGGIRSDYTSTYVNHKKYGAERPAPSYHPAAASNKASRYPPMQLQTTNMRTYISHGPRPRREMIIPQESEQATGEFNNVTQYSHEFQRKTPVPSKKEKTPDDQDLKAKSTPKFCDKTTNKQYFKDHGHYPQTQRFGELPDFTHSLLFPDKENLKELLHSRTQLDFPYKTAKKPKLLKGAEPNIKVGEGEHDLQTTQREFFKHVTSLPKIHSKSAKSPQKYVMPPKMELSTKYNADYIMREKTRPRKAIAPAPDTLEIRMDNRRRVVTEQREKFHGWDVSKHKRPDPCKISDNTERSDSPMCVETTMQRDFLPKHREAERTLPIVKSAKYEPNAAKFRDMTTNKKYFRDWGAKQRLRHGDFHEACNEAQNFTKVNAPEPLPISTTHEVFIEKIGRPRTCLKPDYSTIDTTKLQDFNTISQMAYTVPPASAYIPEDFVVKC